MIYYAFIIIFILFISYYKIYETFITSGPTIKEFKCGVDNSINKIKKIKKKEKDNSINKINKKEKDNLNINCPKSKKECLSRKYLNKCGWCYFKNINNITTGKCKPGNKNGPLDIKKKKNVI